MGIFKKLIKTGIHIASAPVSVAKDVVTLGGALSKDDPFAGTYTGDKVRKILKDINEVKREIDKL